MNQLRGSMLAIVFLLSAGCTLPDGGAGAGSETSAAKAPGGVSEPCVVGFNARGVMAVSVPSGKESVLPHPDDTSMWAPEYDSVSRTLYYVDRAKRAVIAWQVDGKTRNVLYTFGKDDDELWTWWLLLNKYGDRLFFQIKPWEGGVKSTRLVSYDLKSREPQVVFVGPLSPVQRPAWLSDSSLLVITGVRIPGEATLKSRLEELDLAKRNTRVLQEDIGAFALSDDKKTICTRNLATGDYVIRDFPSLAITRTVTEKELPGENSRGNFCIAGNRYLVLFREHDAMSPLGTFLVELDRPDHKPHRLSRILLDSINSMSSLPEWPKKAN